MWALKSVEINMYNLTDKEIKIKPHVTVIMSGYATYMIGN